ncbi:MAG: hypothetical protein ABGX49_06860, partial [Candidatus Poseidoniia archaeon]
GNGFQTVIATTIQTNGTHTTSNAGAAISLTGNVTLQGDAKLDTGAGNSNITVSGTIDATAGGQYLWMLAGTGTIDLQSEVGGATPLNFVLVSNAGTARFGGNVTGNGFQTVIATTIQTNGTHTTSNNDITLTGNVVLQSASGLNTGGGAGNITVSGTINGAQALTLAAGTGNVNLQSAVGGTTALSSLTISSAATANLNDATTTGAQSVTAGTVQTNSVYRTTNSNITITGNLELDSATTFTTGTGTGNITVSGTINGAQSLSLRAGTGTINLQSAVGGTTALSSLTISSASTANLPSIATTGAQSITATTIQTNGTQTTSNSSITLLGNVTLQSNTKLDTGAGNGNITVSGTVNGAQSLMLLAGTGAIDLQDAVGDATALDFMLVSNAGTARFGGNVTSTGFQTVIATMIQTNGTHTTSKQPITLLGNVTLQGNTKLDTGAGKGNITVSGTVNGPQSMTLEAGTGIVDLRGAVGGTTPLSSLTIGSAGTAKLNDATTTGAQSVTAGTVQTNSVYRTTNSNITITGNLELDSATTFTTGTGTGNITVSGTING